MTPVDTPVDLPVVRVCGDVDLSTSGELRSRIAEAVGRGAPIVVVDLTDVGFFDSSGLKALDDAHRAARRNGSALAIACPHERLVRLFEITGLVDTLSVESTPERAARAAAR